MTHGKTIPSCQHCEFYAHSLYMVCAVNPCGPTGDTCPDYRPGASSDSIEWWDGVGATYAGEQIVMTAAERLSREQRLALLDSHPLFTGCCPQCKTFMPNVGQVHGDCPQCGWVDDWVTEWSKGTQS